MDNRLEENLRKITGVRKHLEDDEVATVQSMTNETSSEESRWNKLLGSTLPNIASKSNEKIMGAAYSVNKYGKLVTKLGKSGVATGVATASALGQGTASGIGKMGRGVAGLGRGVGAVAKAPSNAMNRIMEKKFMPAFMFIILGGIDFFVNSTFGHSQFSLIFDVVLTVFGLVAFQSYIVLIAAFFEIVYPRWIAINFGWPNTLPFWAILGVILLVYELSMGEVNMSPGDNFLLIITVLGVALFYVGPADGGWGNIMAQNVNTGPVDKVSGFLAERTSEGWFRVGGIWGDVADCAVPDWMGGAKNCTALERRIDPTYADSIRSKDMENIDPIKFDLSISDILDSEFYTDERIRLRANFNIESGEYPIKGAFVWKIGENKGTTNPHSFETHQSNGKHRLGDTSVYGSWDPGTFTEKGTYTAEVSAAFSVITQAHYRTWFVMKNENLSLDYYYDNYDFLKSNRIPKSESPVGPVRVAVGLGQMEAPIVISDREGDFQPTLVITLNDKNYGSKRKKLKMISYVIVKDEPWFDLSGETSCGEFELKNGLWYLKADSLAKYNRKLSDKAQSPEIYCEMKINREQLFTKNALDPVEVSVNAQVSYEYELRDTRQIKIETPFKKGIYDNIHCVEGTEYKNDYEENHNDWKTNITDEIKKRAKLLKVPYLIALSVAETESNTRQYDKNGLTIRNDNLDSNKNVISADFGVFQINDKSHGSNFNLNDMVCSFEDNVKFGVSYLSTRHTACAHWETALNAYNHGSCVWSKEEPSDYKISKNGGSELGSDELWNVANTESYSRRIEKTCKKLASSNPWSEDQCITCIRRDVNCYTPEELGTEPTQPEVLA